MRIAATPPNAPGPGDAYARDRRQQVACEGDVPRLDLGAVHNPGAGHDFGVGGQAGGGDDDLVDGRGFSVRVSGRRDECKCGDGRGGEQM